MTVESFQLTLDIALRLVNLAIDSVSLWYLIRRVR